MRIAEANRPGQRSRRSWWIRHPVEQAGTVGKRRAVPSHDRSPLDPILGAGVGNCGFEFLTEFSQDLCERSLPSPLQLYSAQPAPTRRIDAQSLLNFERAEEYSFSMPAQETRARLTNRASLFSSSRTNSSS